MIVHLVRGVRVVLYFCCGVLFILGSLMSLAPSAYAANSTEQKIVTFNAGVSTAQQDNFIKSIGATKLKNLPKANAVVIKISSKKANILSIDPRVGRIEDDIAIKATDSVDFNFEALAKKSTQVTPWGISQIKASSAWPKEGSSIVKVAVLDTGIDLSHPDLKANIKGGINTINSKKSADDDNGHGSHVAGIIGALNDTKGVVGADPSVSLYAVKALDKTGSGRLSDIIEGIDWSIDNKMNVINMSLGSSDNSPSFHEAITRAYKAGITLVAAAGNDNGGAVNFPAAYPEVLAISATNSSNHVAGFSDIGPQIALSAPGVDIYSTYKGGKYATLSGTSMASPHVAGAAALVMTKPIGKWDANINGRWDPDEVANKLESGATDLGKAGKDPIYGCGLVNALSAVQ